MTRETPTGDQLRIEHEAMSSTLALVEDLNSVLYKRLQHHYMECVLAARDEAPKRCSKGGYHAWPRNPQRDGRGCLKCGDVPR